MADVTVEAVSQAVNAASFMKLLSSLAQNLPVQHNKDTKTSPPQDQSQALYLQLSELKNDIAKLHRDNQHLREETFW